MFDNEKCFCWRIRYDELQTSQGLRLYRIFIQPGKWCMEYQNPWSAELCSKMISTYISISIHSYSPLPFLSRITDLDILEHRYWWYFFLTLRKYSVRCRMLCPNWMEELIFQYCTMLLWGSRSQRCVVTSITSVTPTHGQHQSCVKTKYCTHHFELNLFVELSESIRQSRKRDFPRVGPIIRGKVKVSLSMSWKQLMEEKA